MARRAQCLLYFNKVLANDWIPGIYRGFKAPEEHSFVNKTTKMETDNEVEVWHAMRATYRRELDAVHLLEKENLGCFVPMQYKVSIRKGKKVRTLVPVIRNLVFVHARPSDVQRVKSQITYLQYITDTRSGQKIGEFYQFNLSSCIRQQNSLTAQFVSFSLSNLANIFYPSQFLQ